MDNLMEFKEVAFAYKEKVILENLNLTIPQNEITVITGSSGVGKSTVLQLAAGFLKPTSGTVLMNQEMVEKPSWHRGVVFQELALFPWLSVEQNITFGLRMRKVVPANYQKPLEQLLEEIQLTKERDYPVYTLSGGMQQRVSLARVFLNNPELLLLDEAFSALDTKTRKQAYQVLLNLQAQFKNTIVLITHNLEEAIFLGQKIIVLGKGTPPTVLDNPYFKEVSSDVLKSFAFFSYRQKLEDLL
ncbi:MAG: ABC transporter ATP-binding protein [Enterococcus sp.]